MSIRRIPAPKPERLIPYQPIQAKNYEITIALDQDITELPPVGSLCGFTKKSLNTDTGHQINGAWPVQIFPDSLVDC